MRSDLVVIASWHSAPPVSLPTSVTSSSPSSSIVSRIAAATVPGETSTPGFAGRSCEPSGSSSVTARRPASASLGTTLRYRLALTSSPWISTTTGPSPALK